MNYCFRCGKCVDIIQSVTEERYMSRITIEQQSDSCESKSTYVLCKECTQKIERVLMSRD